MNNLFYNEKFEIKKNKHQNTNIVFVTTLKAI